jgi:hypothetical protein
MDKMVGKTYGFWTVLESRPENKKGMIKAQCLCGKIKIIRGRSIRNGESKSCGCKTKRIPTGIRTPGSNPAMNGIYSLYRSKSKRQGILFELNINEFKYLTSLNCFYCNAVPANKNVKTTCEYIYNGIDRVDNSKGYNINNCVPCCYICNTHKAAVTKEMVVKIYNFLKENGTI